VTSRTDNDVANLSGEDSIRISPIGVVRSCFPEKFGIPRQPGLTEMARGLVRMLPPWDREDAFRGIEHYSHLWLTFLFHQSPADTWSPTIRPPRLGGNRKIGVFASRSPFRPNRLGLSVVRYQGLIRDSEGLALQVSGIDLVDGTPVLDIKPYLPYADALPEATTTLAQPPEPLLDVRFSSQASAQLTAFPTDAYGDLEQLIVEVLSQDPRPAYRRGSPDQRHYGIRLHDLDIRFQVVEPILTVLEIAKYRPNRRDEGNAG